MASARCLTRPFRPRSSGYSSAAPLSRRLFHTSHISSSQQDRCNRPVAVSVEGASITSIPIASALSPSNPLSLNLDPPPLVETPPPPDEGWLKRTLRKYLKGNMLHTGEVLAKTAFKHCEDPAFRAKLGLPDDLFSVLTSKALHIWMLQQRIHEDVSPEAEAVISRLYEILWNDMENVLNAKGFLVLNKHKKQSQAAVYGGLVTYDKTLQVGAETGDYAPYLSALWRNLYASNREINKNHLVQMRDYIVEQRMRVRGVPENDFYSGLVSFGEPGPVPTNTEAERLDPDIALKPFFEPGSAELSYVFPRSPLRSAKFVSNPLQ